MITTNIFLFILGTIAGSFINMLSGRLITSVPILTARSRCDNCQRLIRWQDLVPIFSYIRLKGRCRECNSKIPIYNLLSEIFLGVVFVVLYLLYPAKLWIFLAIIVTFLVAIIITDFYSYFIYDITLWPIFIVAVIMSKLNNDLWFGLITSVLLTGGILIIAKIVNFSFEKEESLGFGDVKLFFVFGWLFSLEENMWLILIASFSGLIFIVVRYYWLKKSIREKIAFGPFLAGAAIILILLQRIG